MSKLLTLSLLATAALVPFSASADDFYAGAAMARGGTLTFTNPANGKSAQADSKAALKLYGGYALTDMFGLEAGYERSGAATFDRTALGLAHDPTFKIQTWTLAGRLTHHFNEDWSVFGKAGLARSSFTAADGAGDKDSLSSTKPLLGVGVAYNFSKAAALTLEYQHIGRTSKEGVHIRQDMLQLGVKVGF